MEWGKIHVRNTNTMEEAERKFLPGIPRETKGKFSGAARAVGILELKPTALEARIQKLSIGKEHIHTSS